MDRLSQAFNIFCRKPFTARSLFPIIRSMTENGTTVEVQRFLDELAGVNGEASAEPIVGALLSRAVSRLHILCGSLLARSYPRNLVK
jgi:hypothetical protein